MLLITAYVCMMRSPTILSVLPEGGDSRKQVMMVFVLAVIGCAVFTAYAAGLFFRQKSRETGVFLALGATRRQLQREMGKELAVISLGSCAAGAALGGPSGLGRVAAVPPVPGGLPGDGPVLRSPVLSAVHGLCRLRGGDAVHSWGRPVPSAAPTSSTSSRSPTSPSLSAR